MTITVILASDDFQDGAGISISSHFIVMIDKSTKKSCVYNIREQLTGVKILQADESTTLMTDVKNAGTLIAAGVATTVALPLGIVTWMMGRAMADKTKTELAVLLSFDDGKSAVVKMSQKTYDKLTKKRK